MPATDFESASKLQNPSQNEQKQAGASLLLPERYLEATSIDFAELSEQLDTEALLERDAFEEAFDAKVGGHEPPSDTRRPADAVPSGESLSITQIRVAFVDVAGRTRSDSYIRGAIAELAEVPGFRQKRFRLTDVCEALGAAPHDLHFDKLRLSERRNSSRPQNALEAEVLELLRGADLRNVRRQETLKRVLRAFLEE